VEEGEGVAFDSRAILPCRGGSRLGSGTLPPFGAQIGVDKPD